MVMSSKSIIVVVVIDIVLLANVCLFPCSWSFGGFRHAHSFTLLRIERHACRKDRVHAADHGIFHLFRRDHDASGDTSVGL